MKEFAAIQDMSQMPIMERLMHGLTVTALGMGITFIVLILLLYSIKLMSFAFKKEDSPTSLVSDPVAVSKVLRRRRRGRIGGDSYSSSCCSHGAEL